MQSAMPVLEEELRKTGTKRKAQGIVAAGAVFGDIHSAGKVIVCTLRVNIKVEELIEAIENYQAGISAMSAPLECPRSQKGYQGKGIREEVKRCGDTVTADFAESIGADGYDPQPLVRGARQEEVFDWV